SRMRLSAQAWLTFARAYLKCSSSMRWDFPRRLRRTCNQRVLWTRHPPIKCVWLVDQDQDVGCSSLISRWALKALLIPPLLGITLKGRGKERRDGMDSDSSCVLFQNQVLLPSDLF